MVAMFGAAVIGPPAAVCLFAADTYVPMGAGDILLGQPTAVIEVYTPDDPATPDVDEYVSYGPELVLDTFPHVFVLDTGANGLLLGRDPYADTLGESNLEQMRSKGFDDQAGAYRELGVGGYALYSVSQSCDIDFGTGAGSTGSVRNVRIMCSDTQTLADYSGIIGMPVMTGRVVCLDMTPWLGTDMIEMQTRITNDVPPAATPRYRIELTVVEFEQDGQVDPGDPLPSWAPLPFVQVRADHGSVSATGRFLMDTGAQLSMLSEHFAVELGLDSNLDGRFDEDDLHYDGLIEIGGVGTNVFAPIFSVDALAMPTAEGVDLLWGGGTAAVSVIIIEIADALDGVIGMDLLHSGWTAAALGGSEPGAIGRVYFDFRDLSSLTGAMAFDLVASRHRVVDYDSDQDGIPDLWELRHFGNTTNASADALSDWDRDGFQDLHEYRAGTDPADDSSRLEIVDVTPGDATGPVTVTWIGTPGMRYEILTAPRLTGASWHTNRAGIPGRHPYTAATLSTNTADPFLHLRLEH